MGSGHLEKEGPRWWSQPWQGEGVGAWRPSASSCSPAKNPSGQSNGKPWVKVLRGNQQSRPPGADGGPCVLWGQGSRMLMENVES